MSDQTLTDVSFLAFQWDLIDAELGKKTGAPKGETIKKYTQDLILLGRTSVPNDVPSRLRTTTIGDEVFDDRS
jgi:hypothetical protein